MIFSKNQLRNMYVEKCNTYLYIHKYVLTNTYLCMYTHANIYHSAIERDIDEDRAFFFQSLFKLGRFSGTKLMLDMRFIYQVPFLNMQFFCFDFSVLILFNILIYLLLLWSSLIRLTPLQLHLLIKGNCTNWVNLHIKAIPSGTKGVFMYSRGFI